MRTPEIASGSTTTLVSSTMPLAGGMVNRRAEALGDLLRRRLDHQFQ